MNTYSIKCGTPLRFWENKSWVKAIDLYGWLIWYFRYWLGRKLYDNERLKGIAGRFKSKLIKMIKAINGKFDDYAISTMI